MRKKKCTNLLSLSTSFFIISIYPSIKLFLWSIKPRITFSVNNSRCAVIRSLKQICNSFSSVAYVATIFSVTFNLKWGNHSFTSWAFRMVWLNLWCYVDNATSILSLKAGCTHSIVMKIMGFIEFLKLITNTHWLFIESSLSSKGNMAELSSGVYSRA